MTTPIAVSTTVVDRIDRLTETDAQTAAALERFYTVTADVERLDPELFARLDLAWVELYAALTTATWLDGWRCASSPALLLFSGEVSRE